ncbi:MAG: hypothetical protein HRT45_16055 [Bdellovibrionales bacterium]|nr:hypothetical protein [Bdellovibrionales bacterium]
MSNEVVTVFRRVFVCFVALALSFNAVSTEKQDGKLQVTELMTYEGKPVNPYCLDPLFQLPMTRRLAKNLDQLPLELVPEAKSKSVVDLSKCVVPEAGHLVSNQDSVELDMKNETREMYEYRVLKKLGADRFFISYKWNGGGSGYFDGFLVLQVKAEKVAVITGYEIGGDRCNGGVRVEKKDGKLRVLQWLTRADWLELTSAGQQLGLKAYDDLEASAMGGCFAQKTFEIKTAENQKGQIEFKFLGAFTERVANPYNAEDRYPMQVCFDKQVNSLLKGKTSALLQPKEIEAFVSLYKQNCNKDSGSKNKKTNL